LRGTEIKSASRGSHIPSGELQGIVRDPVRYAGKGGINKLQSRRRKFRANQRGHRAIDKKHDEAEHQYIVPIFL